MKSLKKIVWDLMDKEGWASDDKVANALGKEPNWLTVETYKTAWKKQQYLKANP